MLSKIFFIGLFSFVLLTSIGSNNVDAQSSSTERPSYEKPERPSYEKPERPSYEKPERPSYEKPERPSYEKPERPSYEKPAPETSSNSVSLAEQAPTKKKILPPLKQKQLGISPDNIECNSNYTLMKKMNSDKVACIKVTSVDKLILRGWTLS